MLEVIALIVLVCIIGYIIWFVYSFIQMLNKLNSTRNSPIEEEETYLADYGKYKYCACRTIP